MTYVRRIEQEILPGFYTELTRQAIKGVLHHTPVEGINSALYDYVFNYGKFSKEDHNDVSQALKQITDSKGYIQHINAQLMISQERATHLVTRDLSTMLIHNNTQTTYRGGGTHRTF